MTIDEILCQVTVLRDCTIANLGAIGMAVIFALIVGLLIWFFFRRIELSFIGEKIGVIFLVVIGLLGIILGIWFYKERPCFIDYYISTNDLEIEQITKYFDISELSQINDAVVCHIVPKYDYYEDVLNFRNSGKEE